MAAFSAHLLTAAPRQEEHPCQGLHLGLRTEVGGTFSKYSVISVTSFKFNCSVTASETNYKKTIDEIYFNRNLSSEIFFFFITYIQN